MRGWGGVGGIIFRIHKSTESNTDHPEMPLQTQRSENELYIPCAIWLWIFANTHNTRFFFQGRWNVEGGKQRENWGLGHHGGSIYPDTVEFISWSLQSLLFISAPPPSLKPGYECFSSGNTVLVSREALLSLQTHPELVFNLGTL